ncbi:MAG: hypothetical protein NWE96_10370 [Candidatus Bathyarchaeota archaeon]|nr:hypothetical protein [Candidatus Bathyarchaeota archaeon]
MVLGWLSETKLNTLNNSPKFQRFSNYIKEHKCFILGASFFPIVGLILISIWFRWGMIGYAENGLNFYFPGRQFDVFRYLWLQSFGTGLGAVAIISSTSYTSFMAFLNYIGFSPIAVEQILFFILVSMSGLSMYCLTFKLINEKNIQLPASLMAGFFYMLSPFAMVEIWKRFQVSLMFMAVLLPFVLLFYIRGLETKKSLPNALVMCILSLLFSGSFIHPAMIINFWLVIFSYLGFFVLLNIRKRPDILFSLKFTIIIFITWVLVNLWWIAPYLSFNSAISSALSQSVNLYTLQVLSSKIDVLSVSRLVWNASSTYSPQYLWGSIYHSIPFLIISLLIPLIVFSSLLTTKRNRYVTYFVLLAVTSLFLAKGSAPPLGEIFTWFFNNFSFLQVYRNPFEKLGVIIPLAYAFLFGVGLSKLYRIVRGKPSTFIRSSHRLHKLNRKIVAASMVGIVCVCVFVIYPWPMWTGDVFTDVAWINPWYYSHAKIPSYYYDANNWLSNQDGDFRMITLPMIATEGGIITTWEQPYAGGDPNYMLFNTTTISRGWYGSMSDPIVQPLCTNLLGSWLCNQNGWKIMNMLNVKYVVVHDDYNYSLMNIGLSSEELKSGLNTNLEPTDTSKVTSNETQIMDNGYFFGTNSKNGWASLWGINTNIEADMQDGVGRHGSIAMEGNSSDYLTIGNSFGLSYKIPARYGNWTGLSFLHFWIKSNVAGQLFVELYDNSGNLVRWVGSIDQQYAIFSSQINNWTRILIPLRYPSEIPNKQFNLSGVTQLNVALVNLHSNKQTELKISNLSIVEGKEVDLYYLNLTETFGDLHFYLNNKYSAGPEHIYATNNYLLADNLGELYKIIDTDFFKPDNTIVFLSDQNDMSELQKLPMKDFYKPNISFQEQNPTKYSVQINSSEPFFLVFSESYDDNWIASIDGQKICNEYHFVANGYANSWYINKTGTYTITLEFQTQNIFYVGIVASIVCTFFLCAIYALRNKINISKCFYYRHSASSL